MCDTLPPPPRNLRRRKNYNIVRFLHRNYNIGRSVKGIIALPDSFGGAATSADFFGSASSSVSSRIFYTGSSWPIAYGGTNEVLPPLLESLGRPWSRHIAREGKFPPQLSGNERNAIDKRRVLEAPALGLKEGERVKNLSRNRLSQTELTSSKLGVVNLDPIVEDQIFLSSHCVTEVKVMTYQDTGPKGSDSRRRRLVNRCQIRSHSDFEGVGNRGRRGRQNDHGMCIRKKSTH